MNRTTSSSGPDRRLPRHRRFASAWVANVIAASLVLALGTTASSAQGPADTTVSFLSSRPAPAPSATAETVTDSARTAAAGPSIASPPNLAEPPPATLADLGAWIEYKTRSQLPALPDEARLFYRRGLMAHQSGAREEAIQLIRGASQLDPAFVLPYLTLGSWFLAREPGQALAQCAALIEIARQSFTDQLALEANALFAVVQALLLALLAVGVMIVAARNHELRHRWQERFTRFIAPGHARFWAWVILVAPFGVGLGPALPTLVFLGLLWPVMKWAERTVFVVLTVALVCMPLFAGQLDRLGSPLREDREPFYGVLGLQNGPHTEESRRRLAVLERAHPENAFLHFGRAWIARRANDLPDAEAAYRRTLEQWPEDDRVLNNLGSVLSLEGRNDEALEAYDRATKANPFNAAAYYNRARIHTDRYEFRAASEAMEKAAALNFDLLKPYQSQLGKREALPPVDLWIAPRRFWNALAAYRPPHSDRIAVPPAWRTRIECMGWPFSVAVLLCAALAVAFGIVQHRQMPLRYCGNCGRVVCRVCAARRREIALCRACSVVEARAETPEYAKLLLAQQQRAARGRERTLRTALAALIPGFGWVAHRRVFAAWFLLAVAAVLATLDLDMATPFSFEPRLANPSVTIPIAYMIAPWIGIYLISLLGYFVEAQRERVRFETRTQAQLQRRTRSPRRATPQAA